MVGKSWQKFLSLRLNDQLEIASFLFTSVEVCMLPSVAVCSTYTHTHTHTHTHTERERDRERELCEIHYR